MDRFHVDVHLNNSGVLHTMADEVRAGLTAMPKFLSPKYFYNEIGSQLFEQITNLPEYYPTRMERSLLADIADELMSTVQPQDLVELGSGSSTKTRLLLNAPTTPEYLELYIPFDVSASIVNEAAEDLLEYYPFLSIHGVVGDFGQHLERIPEPQGRRLVLFLGSTIGNMHHEERVTFLRSLHSIMGDDGSLLLGVDLVKDVNVLEAAYNDAQGVTAKFNLNILNVLNQGLHADFQPNAFKHRAFFNEPESRIEMHLVTESPQDVTIKDLGLTLHMEQGESIWTESSYKFTQDSTAEMLVAAGLKLVDWYTDKACLFGLALAKPA
jgi:L-histidine N-alpha-methyltransferase